MNIGEISLSQAASKRLDLEHVGKDERYEKVAKDFEGMFVRQLLDKMKDTIGEDEDEDSSTKQIKGMFWSFLGDAVAEQGGFGLWEHLYESMPRGGSSRDTGQILDKSG